MTARQDQGRGRPTAIVWIGLLGVLSGGGAALAGWLLTAPQAATPGDFPMADKVWHVLAFACLTAPACLVLDRRGRWFWCVHMLALAVGSEIVQALAGNGRSGDPLDALADLLGVALAVLAARSVRSRLSQPSS